MKGRLKFIQVLNRDQITIVESLAKEIWSEHFTPIIGKGQVDYMLDRFQTAEAVSGQIREGFLYFLIYTGDEAAGYMAARPDEDEMFLSKLYVRFSCRSMGYGKKAVEYIECLAREKGLTKISLTVNKNNTGSIRAYEKMGFRNVGSVVQDIGGGFVMDDYRMEKGVSFQTRTVAAIGKEETP